MAANWDPSAVVNNTTAPSIDFDITFSENVDAENPLEFLNHLTFGDGDDGLYSYSELEPPKIDCVQDVQDSFCDIFLVPTGTTDTDYDSLQTGGENILEPTPPPVSTHGSQVVPPPDQSPFPMDQYHHQQQEQEQAYHMHIFLVPSSTTDTGYDSLQTGGKNILEPTPPPVSTHGSQVVPPPDHPDQSPFPMDQYHHQQQEQEQAYHMTYPNFPAMSSPNSFVCDNFQQQFGQVQCPFLCPPLLFQRQAAPPIPIPRLPTQTACPRSRNKRCNQKRKVEKVPAEKLDTNDAWSWRKYGKKFIKGNPYPRIYYRCSSSKGCTARKHVEKSNTDPDVYVVCYAGDHNHTRPKSQNPLGSRYRYIGKTKFTIPLNMEDETSSVAPPATELAGSSSPPATELAGSSSPPATEQGSSHLSPVLSATSLSLPTTPPSVSEDHVDSGDNIEGDVGMNNEDGKGDGNSMPIPESDEAKI